MKLSNKNIAAAIEDVRNFFQQACVSHKDVLKICLVIEESLLRYQDRFGEECDFELLTRKWFSAPRIVLRLNGEPFNPLKNEQEDSIFSSEVMRSLLQYDAAGTFYRYENGYNELTSFSTRERKPLKIPGGTMTVAILLAIVASVLTSFLSPDVKIILFDDVVSPILSTLMGLIVTVTVFMMFFSIVSSICAIEDTVMLGNIGAIVLKRFFVLMSVIIFATICISAIFFPIFSPDAVSSIGIGDIVKLFLSVIPTNILDAFLQSNVLQVAIMALATGVCITKIGSRIANVKVIVAELNMLVFRVMSMVFTIIPAAIFLCIFKTLATRTFAEIFSVWQLVVAELITMVVVTLPIIFYMTLRTKTNLRDFLKKISPAVIIAGTTCSSIAAFPKNLELAKKFLNVEERFCSFWLPMALVLFSPSLLIEMIGSAFYAVNISGGSISVIQLLIIAFLAVQLSIATPKVAGGEAASYTILLTQLDLPLELTGTLMIVSVVADNFLSAMNVLIHDCELVMSAHKMNFIKRD